MFGLLIGLSLANMRLGIADMSTISGMTETSKSPAKPTFTSDMKNFLALGGKLFRGKEISDVSKIIDENKDLEARIASLQKTTETNIASLRSAKDSEIAELQSANARLQSANKQLQSAKDMLFVEFQGKYKNWDTGTNRQKDLEDEVATLKLQLTQANERADTSEDRLINIQHQLMERQNESQKLEERLRSVMEKLSKKEIELDGTWTKLMSCESTLQKERQELGLEEPDLDDL